MQTVRIGDTSSIEKKRIVNTSAGCYLLRKSDNKNFELLLLHKIWPDGKEKYVLPKGHKEKEESLEETAKRETIEESGYTDFKLLKYLGSVTYELDWSQIQIKTDHYFLAILNSDQRVDQKSEDYEEDVSVNILWIDIEEGFKLLTYENQTEIHNLVRKFLEIEIS